ncbi:MAG: dethiobiotin synthase [Lachnospiraceae bacterium]|nr:dethiobiotin synthase [Lachnospiraceae bacterium]
MSKTLFVTGTGTDIGKTYVTGLILKKLHVCKKSAAYYKAAMSGNIRGADGKPVPGDALPVKTVAQLEQPLSEMCPYVYEAAVSPHLAARMEGNPVALEQVLSGFDAVCEKYEYVTAEGSGGILCPLRFDEQKLYLEDFIKARNLGCLLVADAGLGTINSVVLTIEYMKARSIPVRGIFFNHFCPGNPMHEDNLKMCEYLTGQKVLTCIRDGDTELDIPSDILQSLYA